MRQRRRRGRRARGAPRGARDDRSRRTEPPGPAQHPARRAAELTGREPRGAARPTPRPTSRAAPRCSPLPRSDLAPGPSSADPADWYGAVARVLRRGRAPRRPPPSPTRSTTHRATAPTRTTDDGQRSRCRRSPAWRPERPGWTGSACAGRRAGRGRVPAPTGLRVDPGALRAVRPTATTATTTSPTGPPGQKIDVHRHPRHRGAAATRPSSWSRTRPTSRWHYTLRSADGHIAQHVKTKDVGWHAGNWYVNAKSIGLEHEGFAAHGRPGTPRRCTARRPRWCATWPTKYDIPLDRQHILGHDNVPGTDPADVAGMHWDPGPYWDWAHYFDAAGAPLRPTGGPAAALVTIRPGLRHQPAAVHRLRRRAGDAVPGARLRRRRACTPRRAHDAAAGQRHRPAPGRRTRPRRASPTIGARAAAGQQLRGRRPAGRLDRDLVPRPEGLVLQPAGS